jgi:hypothetical protein
MDKLIDAVEEEKAWQAYEEAQALQQADTAVLCKTLYDRGVPLKNIFGHYYAFEEQANGRTIDIEDMLLTMGDTPDDE